MTKVAEISTTANSSGPFQGGQNAGAESVQPYHWQRQANPDTRQNGRTRTMTGHVRPCPAGNRWAGHRTDTDKPLKGCPSVRSAHAPDMQALGGEQERLDHGGTLIGLGSFPGGWGAGAPKPRCIGHHENFEIENPFSAVAG
jgi:hypothetical protein